MKQTKLQKEWASKFQPLVGTTIKSIRWLSPKEVEVLGWYSSAVVIELSDGTLLFPSRDDEGNGAGALFLDTDHPDMPTTMPVI